MRPSTAEVENVKDENVADTAWHVEVRELLKRLAAD